MQTEAKPFPLWWDHLLYKGAHTGQDKPSQVLKHLQQ